MRGGIAGAEEGGGSWVLIASVLRLFWEEELGEVHLQDRDAAGFFCYLR